MEEFIDPYIPEEKTQESRALDQSIDDWIASRTRAAGGGFTQERRFEDTEGVDRTLRDVQGKRPAENLNIAFKDVPPERLRDIPRDILKIGARQPQRTSTIGNWKYSTAPPDLTFTMIRQVIGARPRENVYSFQTEPQQSSRRAISKFDVSDMQRELAFLELDEPMGAPGIGRALPAPVKRFGTERDESRMEVDEDESSKKRKIVKAKRRRD